MGAYDQLNPDEYRQELIDMGATEQDADAAQAELVRRQEYSS